MDTTSAKEYLTEQGIWNYRGNPEVRMSREMLAQLLTEFKERGQNKWIPIDEQLPKLKHFYDADRKLNMKEASKTIIVTDGIDSWEELYSEDHPLHKSITHWMHFPLPPKLK